MSFIIYYVIICTHLKLFTMLILSHFNVSLHGYFNKNKIRLDKIKINFTKEEICILYNVEID